MWDGGPQTPDVWDAGCFNPVSITTSEFSKDFLQAYGGVSSRIVTLKIAVEGQMMHEILHLTCRMESHGEAVAEPILFAVDLKALRFEASWYAAAV